jgi:hypothetical protein
MEVIAVLQRRTYSWARLIFLLLLGACWSFTGLNLAAASDIFPGADSHWGKIPGGVAATDGKVVYLASSNDSIEAVDTATGEVIWESKETQRPLAIDGPRLVAQVRRGEGKANLLQLAVLDTATGQASTKPQTVSLPDWIAIDGGIGLTFAASATISDDVMELVWQANRDAKAGNRHGPNRFEKWRVDRQCRRISYTIENAAPDAVLRCGRETLFNFRQPGKSFRRHYHCSPAAGVPRSDNRPAAVAS